MWTAPPQRVAQQWLRSLNRHNSEHNLTAGTKVVRRVGHSLVCSALARHTNSAPAEGGNDISP